MPSCAERQQSWLNHCLCAARHTLNRGADLLPLDEEVAAVYIGEMGHARSSSGTLSLSSFRMGEVLPSLSPVAAAVAPAL